MPENTVKVSRPSPWGNPFTVTDKLNPGTRIAGVYFAMPTAADAVQCFRDMLTNPGDRPDWVRAHIHELRGKNLACWCPLDQPCHADVLLELANTREAPR